VSETSSQLHTPSQSGTPSSTLSRTGTATQSQAISSSLTPSRSQTLTRTRSQASTASSSLTRSASQAGTADPFGDPVDDHIQERFPDAHAQHNPQPQPERLTYVYANAQWLADAHVDGDLDAGAECVANSNTSLQLPLDRRVLHAAPRSPPAKP